MFTSGTREGSGIDTSGTILPEACRLSLSIHVSIDFNYAYPANVFARATWYRSTTLMHRIPCNCIWAKRVFNHTNNLNIQRINRASGNKSTYAYCFMLVHALSFKEINVEVIEQNKSLGILDVSDAYIHSCVTSYR